MFLSEPWRLGLTGLAIGLNTFTVLAHSYYGFDTVLPLLASHRKPLYNVIGVCFIHLMLLPIMSSKYKIEYIHWGLPSYCHTKGWIILTIYVGILQLKWLQYGLDSPYDKPLLTCYVLGHLGFGGWYYALGTKAPLLSTVVAPIATLLCVLWTKRRPTFLKTYDVASLKIFVRYSADQSCTA
jgi:hypothetical protein